jgi:hypothetical protein
MRGKCLASLREKFYSARRSLLDPDEDEGKRFRDFALSDIRGDEGLVSKYAQWDAFTDRPFPHELSEKGARPAPIEVPMGEGLHAWMHGARTLRFRVSELWTPPYCLHERVSP